MGCCGSAPVLLAKDPIGYVTWGSAKVKKNEHSYKPATKGGHVDVKFFNQTKFLIHVLHQYNHLKKVTYLEIVNRLPQILMMTLLIGLF